MKAVPDNLITLLRGRQEQDVSCGERLWKGDSGKVKAGSRDS